MAYLLVTGSRNYSDETTMREQLRSAYRTFGPLTLVHGGCRGADLMAAEIWSSGGLETICVPADWDRHGKGAGPIRNQAMIDQYRPVVCLAFPVGDSKGTQDCVSRARKAGVPVWTPQGV